MAQLQSTRLTIAVCTLAPPPERPQVDQLDEEKTVLEFFKSMYPNTREKPSIIFIAVPLARFARSRCTARMHCQEMMPTLSQTLQRPNPHPTKP